MDSAIRGLRINENSNTKRLLSRLEIIYDILFLLFNLRPKQRTIWSTFILYLLGGYTSSYCKDKTPEACEKSLQCVYNGDQQRFEDEFCSVSKAQEITCLKTCRRCLSKSKTMTDQNKSRRRVRCNDVSGKYRSDPTIEAKGNANVASSPNIYPTIEANGNANVASSPNISIILIVFSIVFQYLVLLHV